MVPKFVADTNWIERFVIMVIIITHYWNQLPLVTSTAAMIQTGLSNKEGHWFMKHVIEKWGRLQGQFKPVTQCCHEGLGFFPFLCILSFVGCSSQGFRIGASCFLTHSPIFRWKGVGERNYELEAGFLGCLRGSGNLPGNHSLPLKLAHVPNFESITVIGY